MNGLLGRRRHLPGQFAGLRLWLRADAAGNYGQGDPVDRWLDRSGNGNDATQATAGLQPTFQTGVINGLPAVRFDGLDDILTISGAGLGISGAFSFLLVYRSSNSAADAGVFGNGIDAHAQVTHDVASFIYHYVGSGGNTIFWARGTGVWTVDVFVWDGTLGANGLRDWAEGVLKGQRTSSVQPSSTADYQLGLATSYWGGDIAEVIVYNRALSDDERKRLERYLGRKYASAIGTE